jgi:Outer membrane protein beta-barrel domain
VATAELKTHNQSQLKNMKKHLLVIFLTIWSTNAFSQNNKDKLYTKKPRFNGFTVGLIGSDFYRLDKDKFQSPLKNPTIGLHAGVIIDIINLKRFASQIELNYVQKGATETFNNSAEQEYVSVKSKLHYAQIDFIPIVAKPFGYNSFNPYFSIGGYGSFLLGSNFEYLFSDKFNTANTITKTLDVKTLNTNDYGLLFNVGVKLGSISLEYRHEFGLKPIFNDNSIKNQLNNVTIRLTR